MQYVIILYRPPQVTKRIAEWVTQRFTTIQEAYGGGLLRGHIGDVVTDKTRGGR